MPRRVSILIAVVVTTASGAAAQTPRRTTVGASFSVLPASGLEVDVARQLLPRLLLHASGQLYSRTNREVYVSAPCPPSGCAPTGPAEFLAVDVATGAAIGIEFFEHPDRAGIFLNAMAGIHRMRDENSSTTRVGTDVQLGIGASMPFGRSRFVIEARVIRFSGANLSSRALIPLTFGLRI